MLETQRNKMQGNSEWFWLIRFPCEQSISTNNTQSCFLFFISQAILQWGHVQTSADQQTISSSRRRFPQSKMEAPKGPENPFQAYAYKTLAGSKSHQQETRQHTYWVALHKISAFLLPAVAGGASGSVIALLRGQSPLVLGRWGWDAIFNAGDEFLNSRLDLDNNQRIFRVYWRVFNTNNWTIGVWRWIASCWPVRISARRNYLLM